MREAIVAAEDQRFYSNSGIDPLAIARAAWRDITGHNLQGGSTITQQYVKNVYTGSEQTALRKLREASLAIRLERHLTKDQILTRYLNTLYLGNGTAGVEAASRFYFGVPISKLDLNRRPVGTSSSLALARAATLAGDRAGAVGLESGQRPAAGAGSRAVRPQPDDPDRATSRTQEAARRTALALPHIAAATEPDAQTIAPEFRDIVAAATAALRRLDAVRLRRDAGEDDAGLRPAAGGGAGAAPGAAQAKGARRGHRRRRSAQRRPSRDHRAEGRRLRPERRGPRRPAASGHHAVVRVDDQAVHPRGGARARPHPDRDALRAGVHPGRARLSPMQCRGWRRLPTPCRARSKVDQHRLCTARRRGRARTAS